ncbi:sulfotransferase family protein [Mangrovimonas xylaniphaga]|uniref:sulfotransferase family protein n=1 Tax=Mangrovimonas xylaniphaga TaxID=1645915 RepID=UPI0006B69283|nr:sulfotransferase [Mangrovimonas xylaniphaga]
MGKTLNFLTGLPRSGTTWLADILGAHGAFNFLSGEVFNPGTSAETFGLDELPWFVNETTLPRRLEHRISKALLLEKDYLFFLKRYGILLQKRVVNPKNYLRLVKHLMYMVNKKPIFTKDPIGLFMISYLYHAYHAKIVVVKRDPYRFTASMKRMHWYLDFSYLPLEYQQRFEREIAHYHRETPNDLVGNVLIWWLVFEEHIKILKQKQIPLLEIRHEQVLNDPNKVFSDILEFYGVQMDNNVQSKIDFYVAKKENKTSMADETHQMNRSRAQIKNSWKDYLAESDIELIRVKTNINPPV